MNIDTPLRELGEVDIAALSDAILAQSPEAEVQGRFVEAFRDSRSHGGRDAPRLLVLLDEERYAATAEAERVEERVRAWQRVVREAGCEALLDLVEIHVNDG